MRHLLSRRHAIASLAASAAGLAAMRPVGAAELRVPHRKGEAVLPGRPQRIAVFDLAALDILQVLGVEVAGVPKAMLPAYLARYGEDRYAKIGTLFEPDPEALRALRPDLIIVGGRSSAKYEELARIAPTLDLSTGTTDFLGDVVRNLRILGQATGKHVEAEAEGQRFFGEVRALHAKAAGKGTGLLLFAAGSGVSAQAPGTRFGIIYDLIGIRPVIAASEAPAAARPARAAAPAPGTPEAAAADAARREAGERQAEHLEAALSRNPDWLFVLDRNAATGGKPVAAERLSGNAALRATKAWTAQQVIHLDAPGWYLVGGGLGNLRATIAQISAAFDARR